MTMTAGDAISGPDPHTGAGSGAQSEDSYPPETRAPGCDQLVHEGLDHLQRAARETIAAMRALLDLAEQLIEDPRAAETMVATIGSLAETTVRSAGSLLGSRPAARSPGGRRDDEDGGGVQRIPVS